MAINCYSGLMGSGKSYEVVSSIVIPGIRDGRRVVTNIRGIDNDAIRAYCVEKFNVPMDKLGHVVSITDAQASSYDFFPTEHMTASGEVTSSVFPGDLVAIDEAYKIWGADCTVLNQHKVFFREHRHFTHPESGVTCDLVLMTQDIGDLHRVIRVVIEQSFRTHKAKGIGLNNLYTITMWEGWKQTRRTIVKDWTKTYDPEIFPLYKSYAGQRQGKEMSADGRQNIFSDRKSLFKYGFFFLALCFVGWRLFNWWWIKTHPEKQEQKPTEQEVQAHRSGQTPTSRPSNPVSSQWRLAGVVVIDGKRQVVLTSGAQIRLEDGVMFIGDGLRQSGSLDGDKITRFSGQPIVQAPAK